MKTQTLNKLELKKRSLVELNDNQLNDVNGGHPTVTTLIGTTSTTMVTLVLK